MIRFVFIFVLIIISYELMMVKMILFMVLMLN